MKRWLLILLFVLQGTFLISAKQTLAVFQCVEFPYIQLPRPLWERELVWMKNIGVQSIALSVPADWTPEDLNPNHDLQSLLRILRRLGLTAWVRPEQGSLQFSQWIELQRESHGGPVLYLGTDQVPQPVHRVSLLSAANLLRRREWVTSSHGTIWWTDAESTVSPEFRRGAVSLGGEEDSSIGALRKDLALLRYWGSVLQDLSTERKVRPVATRLPENILIRQLVGTGHNAISAVSVVNESKTDYQGELRAYYPPLKREIVLPAIHVPARESLWLPINLPLGREPFCQKCNALGVEDSLVYATAELTGVEYENGILAMEFAAPAEGEVVLHLAREPNGPLLAGGKPREFDWDKATNRVKLPIPAGTGPARRVRIGIALDAPEHSAYFGDTKVLIAGQKNRISTHYSSEEVAKRSRLQVPSWVTVTALEGTKDPLEIDYELNLPAEALHGDHVELALLESGAQLSHTRLQILRGASLRIREGISRHFSPGTEIAATPALVPLPLQGGRNISVTLRNNYPEIKNYVVELSGEGLTFSPSRTEISVGASTQRDVSVRVFAEDGPTPLRIAKIKLSGTADVLLETKFVVIPRGQTVTYTADLLGDGRTEYILETEKTRAIFADKSQNRWLEFVWKAEERNVLSPNGIDLGRTANRKISLTGSELTLEQPLGFAAPLPTTARYGNITLEVKHPSATHTVFQINSSELRY